MQEGSFEKDEVEVITYFMGKCDLFIDIGANFGYFSCLVRKMGRPVISVEPHPQNIRILKRNLKLNNWNDIKIYEVGLSDKEGKFKLWGGSTGASFVQGWADVAENWYTEVPVTTCNKLFDFIDKELSLLIKIDVEGAEYDLIKDATDFLKRKNVVWLVEICYSLHRKIPNVNYLDTFNIFLYHGYKVYSSTSLDREFSISEIEEIMVNPHLEKKYYNWIFVAHV